MAARIWFAGLPSLGAFGILATIVGLCSPWWLLLFVPALMVPQEIE